ncbi:hypothetical protein BC629DRAFT_1445416 [Irpex lacteus]|nr:hypothetical protein BC629DRAFT_1445416 [Irpex lacteus]
MAVGFDPIDPGAMPTYTSHLFGSGRLLHSNTDDQRATHSKQSSPKPTRLRALDDDETVSGEKADEAMRGQSSTFLGSTLIRGEESVDEVLQDDGMINYADEGFSNVTRAEEINDWKDIRIPHIGTDWYAPA